MTRRKLTSDEMYHLIQLMEIVRDPTTAPDDALNCAGDALDYLDPEEVAKYARAHMVELVKKMLSLIRDPATAEEMKDECAEMIVDIVAKMLAKLNEQDRG